MAENKGTWLDTKTGKLVTSQPEEGVQVVSPNVEANPDDEAALQRMKDALAEQAAADKPAAKTIASK
jgi:hypothetical protein